MVGEAFEVQEAENKKARLIESGLAASGALPARQPGLIPFVTIVARPVRASACTHPRPLWRRRGQGNRWTERRKSLPQSDADAHKPAQAQKMRNDAYQRR